jgi:hypothetical protein
MDLDRLVVVPAVGLWRVELPVYRALGISGLRGIIPTQDIPRVARRHMARQGMDTLAERMRR